MSPVTEDLEQLTRNLKLRRIGQILDRELSRVPEAQPSHAEFLERLLREEYQYQQDRRVESRIQRARLPERWSLETFPFKKQPGVKASVIKELARLEFIGKGENLIFMGGTGVGKTGLASALLLKAVQNGYNGLFLKAQDMFDEMFASLADRSTRKLVNRLMRIDVLLVDELGYLNLRPEQPNIFFKLIEERYTQKRVTLITTNLEYDDWYSFLQNKAMTGALLDRIRHRCHTIRIDGPTLRSPAEQ